MTPIKLFTLLFILLSSQIISAKELWKKINTNIDSTLEHIEFIDDKGWIVGHNGTLLSTENAGTSWSTTSFDTTYNISFIDFISPEKGWAIANGEENIAVLSTEDGGESWTKLAEHPQSFNPLVPSLVQFTNPQKGWLFTNPSIYSTEDGGNSWQESLHIEPSFSTGKDIDVHGNTLWIATWGGGLLHSEDDGAQWKIKKPEEIYYITGVDLDSEKNGWVAGYHFNSECEDIGGYYSYIFKTTEGADNLEAISNLCGYSGKINFINELQGWLLLHNGNGSSSIMASKDGGLSWQEQYQTETYIRDLYMIDENNGWAVGDEGMLLHFQQTTVIDEEKDSDLDGIPDQLEDTVGLDPQNPEDANHDLDTDGFSNLFEYQNNTKMDDASSHPSIHTDIQSQGFSNISTRGKVGTGADVMIAGFIIEEEAKTVVITAQGQSLLAQGVLFGLLADPLIELYSGQTLLQSNDNWLQGDNVEAIQATVFAPTNDKEAAILTTLKPGAYTVIVRGVNNSTGISVVSVNLVH